MIATYAALVFIFGTLVGSFSNVLILRHGFSEKKRKRSHCGACGVQLVWYELVPVVSYVLLRGRCNTCGSKLSIQYPLVEILLGVLFVATFLTSYPFFDVFDVLMFLALLAFWTSFVVLTVYDLKHTLVPYSFSGALIGSAVLFRVFEAFTFTSLVPLYDAAIGAVLFGGFLYALFLLTRGRGMGLGDAHVGVALGVLFGLTRTFEVITLSFWIGAVLSLMLLALKKGFTIKNEVPFVPFLFLGSIIGAFTDFSPMALIARAIYGV